MFKFEVMGHMKGIEQMIRDGSFDRDFVPAYNKALNNDLNSFLFGGSVVSTEYASVVVTFVNEWKQSNRFN
tara:strand:- start:256 stop:468 length:213 start_codon:yes stop_codon:yes gene_type:complete